MVRQCLPYVCRALKGPAATLPEHGIKIKVKHVCLCLLFSLYSEMPPAGTSGANPHETALRPLHAHQSCLPCMLALQLLPPSCNPNSPHCRALGCRTLHALCHSP